MFSDSHMGLTDMDVEIVRKTSMKFVVAMVMLLFVFCPRVLWADINGDFLTLCSEGPNPAEFITIEKALSQAIAKGANVNYQAPNGETPLIILTRFLSAGRREDEFAVEVLLNAGAEIDARDRAGNTALIHAVKNSAPASLVWRLLEKKADVNAKNDAGLTALRIAAEEVANPAVTAVLLLAGAEISGVAEAVAENPNREELAALVEYFLAHQTQMKAAPPLFADLSSGEGLRSEIKVFDDIIRNNFNNTVKYNFGSYVEWQYRLPSDVNAYIRLGQSPRAAWLMAYDQHLKDITANKSGASTTTAGLSALPEARLIVSGNYGSRHEGDDASTPASPEYIPKYLVADRSIMIVEWPAGLVGYETATGRELWRAPQTGTFMLNGVIFGIDVLSDSGDTKIQAVEVFAGRPLWQMEGGCPTWATDHGRKKFFLDMGHGGGFFDFDMFGKSEEWVETYDFTRLAIDWTQKYEMYKPMRQKKLAEHGLKLATDPMYLEDGQQYSDSGLLLTNEFMGLLADDGGYCGCAPVFQRGSNDTISSSDALAVDSSGFFRFSIWGSDRSLSNPDQPLLLFDRIEDRVSELKLGNGRLLTGRDLRVIQRDGDEGFSLAFSPEGSALGVMDQAGDMHFFDARGRGRHIGSIHGQTKVAVNSKTLPISELQFVSILDEDISGQPVCQFSSPDNPRQPLILKLNLAQNQAVSFFSPERVATSQLTAFDLSSENIAAVGLDNGALRLLDLKDGRPLPVELENTSPWVRLAFSGNGEVLFAANEAGIVYSIKAQTATKVAEGLQKIIHLVVDTTGLRAWATACEGFDNTCSVTFIDNTGNAAKSSRAPLEGSLIALVFDQERNQAKAIIGQAQGNALNANGPVQFSSLLNKSIQTHLLITSDSLTAPGLDSFGSIWDIPINAGNLGFAPNQKILITEPDCECGIGVTQHFYIGVETGKRGALEPKDLTPGFMGATFFSPDSQLAVLAERTFQSRFFLYNTQTGDMLASMTDTSKHPMGITSGAFLNDGSPRIFTAGPDGTLRLWDLNGGNPVNILTWIFFQDGNWLALDTDSRFDTPDLDRLEGVHWTVKKLPGVTIPLASLMRVYYQPRLPEYVLKGKELPSLTTLDQLNLNQHGVRRVDIKPEPVAPDKVAVTVEVYVRGNDANHPAQELKLFRDGQLVGKYTGENKGLFDLPEGKRQVTFRNIALPQNKTQVRFKAWAFNEDGVRSKYFDRPYDYKPVAKPEPTLHLVSVGVNRFDNPAWDLKLAANDAKGYAEILPAKLSNIKADVHLLASGDGLIKPDKANLKAALKKLAEDGSSPDDIVVLAIASHGLTDDKDNQFYILPADIPGRDKGITPELLVHSISTDELSDWLTTVDAAEIIMILDTCQSGAALGGDSFKPGPMGDKGLGQLAYDKAMRVLTATNENNAAMEVDDLGHGLLSYALLVDGLGKGLAGKGEFSFKDWLVYGQKRTAELYAKIARGESVGETRGRVKVDKTADNANPPLGQEPYLFDFGGNKEIIRFQVK